VSKDNSEAAVKEPEVSEAQAQRDAAALAQNTVVPEQRPQAFNENRDTMSPLSARIAAERAEKGWDDSVPMGQDAYDRANDPKIIEQTQKDSLPQSLLPASVIRITDGIMRGRLAAVLRIVSYESPEALLAANSRNPSLFNHEAHPAEIEVSFRGDDRDGEIAVLNLVDKDSPYYAAYEVVTGGFTGRGAMVAGAV